MPACYAVVSKTEKDVTLVAVLRSPPPLPVTTAPPPTPREDIAASMCHSALVQAELLPAITRLEYRLAEAEFEARACRTALAELRRAQQQPTGEDIHR